MLGLLRSNKFLTSYILKSNAKKIVFPMNDISTRIIEQLQSGRITINQFNEKRFIQEFSDAIEWFDTKNNKKRQSRSQIRNPAASRRMSMLWSQLIIQILKWLPSSPKNLSIINRGDQHFQWIDNVCLEHVIYNSTRQMYLCVIV